MPCIFKGNLHQFTPSHRMSSKQINVGNGKKLTPQLNNCTAEKLADLDFDCKKEDYYAIATIVTEAFLTGLYSRNEVIFKNKTKTSIGTKLLFLHRLTVRLKTDQSIVG